MWIEQNKNRLIGTPNNMLARDLIRFTIKHVHILNFASIASQCLDSRILLTFKNLLLSSLVDQRIKTSINSEKL